MPNFMKLECQGSQIYTFPAHARARAFVGNKSLGLFQIRGLEGLLPKASFRLKGQRAF